LKIHRITITLQNFYFILFFIYEDL